MTKHRNLSATAAWQRSGGAHDSTTPRGEAEREAIEEQRDEGDALSFDAVLAVITGSLDDVPSTHRAAFALLAAAAREWHGPRPEFLRAVWHATVYPPRDPLTQSSRPVWVGAMALAVLRMTAVTR